MLIECWSVGFFVSNSVGLPKGLRKVVETLDGDGDGNGEGLSVLVGEPVETGCVENKLGIGEGVKDSDGWDVGPVGREEGGSVTGMKVGVTGKDVAVGSVGAAVGAAATLVSYSIVGAVGGTVVGGTDVQPQEPHQE